MSDVRQGPDWWMASDGKWYPPQSAAAVQIPPPSAPQARNGCAIAALVVGVFVAATVVVAVLAILAITFLGSSAEEKLEDVGSELESVRLQQVP